MGGIKSLGREADRNYYPFLELWLSMPSLGESKWSEPVFRKHRQTKLMWNIPLHFHRVLGSPVHLAGSTKIVVNDGMNYEEMIFLFSGLLGEKKGWENHHP
jgi:hypothetical protein